MASNSSSTQCLIGPTYRSYSTSKSYSCQVKSPELAAIVGTDLDFKCSTSPPANATAGGWVGRGQER